MSSPDAVPPGTGLLHPPRGTTRRGGARGGAAKAVVGVFTLALATTIPSARATLPPWLQHVVGASTIEAALYRVMSLPSAQALYPRPPKESQAELARLIAGAPADAELYALRARADEAALDFASAEADWKLYTSKARDPISARLELADFYHRQLRIPQEVQTLREVAAAPAPPSERFDNPTAQRSWLAFERLLALIAEQGLPPTETQATYEAFLARYPAQPAVYARAFQFLLDQQQYPAAEALIPRFRQAFPQDTAFPIRAQALLEYRRGNEDRALAVYDQAFQPLWPADLVGSYYALLAQTHRQRAFVADARARLAAHPDGPEALNGLARIFYYQQQQGRLDLAGQTIDSFRIAREQRNAAWTSNDLATLAALTGSIHSYAEAARYNYALASSPGNLPAGEPAAQAGLAGLVDLLLSAPDQPIALGAGNLTLYRDIATLDQGPGYWNGILSLWLNGTSPQSEYNAETAKSQGYFHRAKAAELLLELDRRFPAAPQRANLHLALVRVYTQYGEPAEVIAAGKEFLAGFPTSPERVDVANLMADAYARQGDTAGEFALYDAMLTELGARLKAETNGMPLSAAASASAQIQSQATIPSANEPDPSSVEADATAGAPAAAATATAKPSAPQLNLGTYAPQAPPIPGAGAYSALLDRYVGRLVAVNQPVQALAVLRRQLDLNPGDPLLYERLATFLQQNNLSGQQEQLFRAAIARFQQPTWYDKLARLYLRERNREAYAALTRQVTDIFSGTDLDQWFASVGTLPQLNPSGDRSAGPQLALQLNLYAEHRFPHDLVFTRNLLSAYQSIPTRNPAAYDALIRRHWWEDEQLRAEFFDYLSRTGKLQPELANLQTLIPDSTRPSTLSAPSIDASSRSVGSASSNPAAARELAEAHIWNSHFESAAPLLAQVAELYPADPDLGDRAVSVLRSLSYLDPTSASLDRAVAIEKNLAAADPASSGRLATLGDLYAEATATGGEDIRAAAPFWRRIPAIHPGTPEGYLTSATIFWDYFQFNDALAQLRAARDRFHQPALYGYEAGAIAENRRDLPEAIAEYTAAALAADDSTQARARLLQLATRAATRSAVDAATARAASEHPAAITAVSLRADVLVAQHRQSELPPLLDAALAKASTPDDAAALGALAQAHALTPVYERSLTRQIALTADPVEKIQLSYTLAASLEARKDIPAASRIIDSVYRASPRILGVVRATTDFYARTNQPPRAIATLLEASRAATPTLARSFTLEAAQKANDSGDTAQARALALTLLPATPYDAQVLGIIAASYSRANDNAGLKAFFEARLAAANTARLAPAERRQDIALLRRGLIPALTGLKDYEGALNQYIALLSAFPEDSATAQEAALYALRYQRQPQLVGFLRTTVQQSPRDSRFAILLAQVDTTFEDLPGALLAYNSAIAVRKDRADLYQARVDLELRLGLSDPAQLEAAAADFTRLYILSYKDPSWMVRLAELRARQRRPAEAVQALQTAYITGRTPSADNDFRVAAALAGWNLLAEAGAFAQQGAALAGPDLLLPRYTPGVDEEPSAPAATTYARILTRLGKPDEALTTLAAARRTVDTASAYPADLEAQFEDQGVSAADRAAQRSAWLQQRQLAADTQLTQGVTAVGATAQQYFTPEQKLAFAQTLDRLHAPGADPSLALTAATAAGLTDREAAWRKELILTGSLRDAPAQAAAYTTLQQSRLAYPELAQTLEAYAARLRGPRNPSVAVLEQAAQAWRDAGDETNELRLRRSLALRTDTIQRDRYFDLLLRRDRPALAALAGNNGSLGDDGVNYILAHMDQGAALAAVAARGRSLPPIWRPASASLVLTYFASAKSPGAPADFAQSLAFDASIADRLATHADPARQLTGDLWFYYASRFGIYLDTVPRTAPPPAPLPDPEDFLPAELERAPTSTAGYLHLAQTRNEAGDLPAAVVEFNHALELAPDSVAIHNALAVMLYPAHTSPAAAQRDQAISQWRASLAILRGMQQRNSFPEAFYTGLETTLRQLGQRGLAVTLRPEIEAILRAFFARNGNYRSNELLQAAYQSAPSPADGVAFILSLANSAADPGSLLGDLDHAAWLNPQANQQLLIRRLQLAQQASPIASSASNQATDYSASRVIALQLELLDSYLALGQDAPAQALLDTIPAKQQQENAQFASARIVLAARAGRLQPLLDAYRASPETAPSPDILTAAANTLAHPSPPRPPDYPAARSLREFVFDQKQLSNSLIPSDFLALAQLRLETNDLPGALQLLHRLTLQPSSPSASQAVDLTQTANPSSLDDQPEATGTSFRSRVDSGLPNPYANTDSAAALLEAAHHPAEAIPFLTSLVQSAPWNSTYKLRLAHAQRDSGHNDIAARLLAEVAADASAPYALRVQAALNLKPALKPVANPAPHPAPKPLDPANSPAPVFGSAELALLASPDPTPAAARQPYFAEARLAAAANPGTAAPDRIALLREAIAIVPTGASADRARLTLLQLQADTANPSAVIAILGAVQRAPQQSGAAESRADSADTPAGNTADDTADDTADADSEASSEVPATGDSETLTPTMSLPAIATPLDLPARIHLAQQLSAVYLRDGQPSIALGYAQLAVVLDAQQPHPDPAVVRRRDTLKARVDIDARNAQRRPVLHKELAQSTQVRPRLPLPGASEAP